MKVKPTILLSVLLAGTLAAALLAWNSARQSQAENEALRAQSQAEREQAIAEAAAQNQDLTRQVEQLRAEAQDLPKLRSEVGRLRSTARELETLRAENLQLRSTTPAAPNAAAPTPPARAADQFPRDSWSFAGYSSPEAALISAVWAMREGNSKTYLDSLSPEEQERMTKTWENKPESEIAAKHQQDVSSITGFRILEKQLVGSDEIVMDVYVQGAGRMEKVSMKRVANDWKFGGYIRPPAK